MNTITVQPITTSKFVPEELTFFTRSSLSNGALVNINVRSNILPAIVSHSVSLTTNKAVVKKSAYALKKVQSIISDKWPFNHTLLAISKQISKYSVSHRGSILKIFLPSPLISQPIELSTHHYQYTQPSVTAIDSNVAVIGNTNERIDHYKSVLLTQFAKRSSIALFAPTVAKAEYLEKYLSYLPRKCILIHGQLSKKQILARFNLLNSSSDDYIIVGTPIMLGILTGRENTIIIEDSDSLHYRRNIYPFVDQKAAILEYARHRNISCLEGKFVPSVTDMYMKQAIYYTGNQRQHTSSVLLFDASNGQWLPITQDARKWLQNTENRLLIFINRKGYYSFVICVDCGSTVLCSSCSHPLTLHEKRHNQRHYICHNCSKTSVPSTECNQCGSWNLKGYGLGTQQLLSEVKKIFPDRMSCILDDSVKNTDSIVSEFLKSDCGIIIGTEKILEIQELSSETVFIASIDNLFSIPDISINTRAVELLFKLGEKSRAGQIAIQTRFPSHPVFQSFMRGSTKELIKKELEERVAANLPPHSFLIKLSTKKKAGLKETAAKFKKLGLEVTSYNSYTDKNIHNILLSIPNNRWPHDKAPQDIFNTIEKDWDIVVDPVTIL